VVVVVGRSKDKIVLVVGLEKACLNTRAALTQCLTDHQNENQSMKTSLEQVVRPFTFRFSMELQWI